MHTCICNLDTIPQVYIDLKLCSCGMLPFLKEKRTRTAVLEQEKNPSSLIAPG